MIKIDDFVEEERIEYAKYKSTKAIRGLFLVLNVHMINGTESKYKTDSNGKEVLVILCQIVGSKYKAVNITI